MSPQTITKEQFLAYEAVRVSGVTNMFDIKTVQKLARVPLTKEDCLTIMKHYTRYKKQYTYSSSGT